MSEPQTDAERIEWLWNRLDALNGEKATMQARAEMAERQVDERDAAIAKLNEIIQSLNVDLISLSKQVNESRSSAATAVHDYIERTAS